MMDFHDGMRPAVATLQTVTRTAPAQATCAGPKSQTSPRKEHRLAIGHAGPPTDPIQLYLFYRLMTMADDPDKNGQPALLANHIVAHKASQYSGNGGGVSACGLAAVNCARLLLQKDKSGVHGFDLVREMSKAETFEVPSPFRPNLHTVLTTASAGDTGHLRTLVRHGAPRCRRHP